MCVKKIFYKYTDAEGAKKIMGDLKILYTSPGKFNDPFDCKIGLRLDYEHEKFGPLFIGKLYLLLFSDSRPELLESFNKREILDIWESNDDERKIKLIEDFHTSWKKKEVLRNDEERNESAINLIMSKYRIFCVSEIYDDILMWAHYADEHKGAVIKLLMPENPLGCWRFKKVTYSYEFPIHNTTEQLVDNMLGFWRPNPEDTASKLVFTKSRHWEYEREWRDVVRIDEPDNFDEGRHLFDIEEERILGVYFGVNIKGDDREEIMQIVSDKFPHVEVYQAIKDNNRFKLNFARETYA